MDDAGRIVDICEIGDDSYGYAYLSALLAERATGSYSVAIATDSEERLVPRLLSAAGWALALVDRRSAEELTSRYGNDESTDGESQRRALGLARAVQAGALLASQRPVPPELTELQPLLAAHAALATSRHATATALREVLRELYPAALRAYPDPADPIALAVMDALPEPRAVNGRGADALAPRLAETGLADQAAIAEAVNALRVAVRETSRRGGVASVLGATVAETVRQAVAAVRSCDAASSALVGALVSRVNATSTAATRIGADTGENRYAGTDPTDSRYAGTDPTGTRYAGTTADADLTGTRYAGTDPTGTRYAGTTADADLTGTRHADTNPTGTRYAGTTADANLTGTRHADTNPTGTRYAGTTADTNLTGTRHADTNPTGTRYAGTTADTDASGSRYAGAAAGSDLGSRRADSRAGSEPSGSRHAAPDPIPVRGGTAPAPAAPPHNRPLSPPPPPPPGITPIPPRQPSPPRSGLGDQAVRVPVSRPAPDRPPLGSRSDWPTSPPADDEWATTSTNGAHPRRRTDTDRGGIVEPPWRADDLRLPEPPPLHLGPSLPGESDFREPTLDFPDDGPGDLGVGTTYSAATSDLPLGNGVPRSAPPVAADDDDTLLIFQQIRSAWFNHDPAATWNSAMDLGWQAAEQAARPTVGDRTGAGLPRRVPHANLVPGAPPRTEHQPLDVVRDPASIAANTSGYFNGWRRGQQVGGFPLGSRQGPQAGAWEFDRDDNRMLG